MAVLEDGLIAWFGADRDEREREQRSPNESAKRIRLRCPIQVAKRCGVAVVVVLRS